MRAFFLSAVIAASASGPALAENMSGNSLYEACTTENGVTAGFCIGYVVGVIEGIRYGLAVPMWSAGEDSSEVINKLSDGVLMYCPPPEVQNGQHVDVVNKYLQSHPEKRHMPARLLIHIALREAFPCEPS